VRRRRGGRRLHAVVLPRRDLRAGGARERPVLPPPDLGRGAGACLGAAGHRLGLRDPVAAVGAGVRGVDRRPRPQRLHGPQHVDRRVLPARLHRARHPDPPVPRLLLAVLVLRRGPAALGPPRRPAVLAPDASAAAARRGAARAGHRRVPPADGVGMARGGPVCVQDQAVTAHRRRSGRAEPRDRAGRDAEAAHVSGRPAPERRPPRALVDLLGSSDMASAYALTTLGALFGAHVLVSVMGRPGYSAVIVGLCAVGILMLIVRRRELSIVRLIPTTVVLFLGWLLVTARSEEHTSELQSRENLVCR